MSPYSPAVLSASCLGSGVALILTITFRQPLWATLSVAAAAMCLSVTAVWRRSSPRLRVALLTRLRVGVMAGVLATAAYDGMRWLLVFVLGFRVSPFGALPLFGASLLGSFASRESVWLAGFVYHVTNGVLFAAAYAVLLGQRRWWWGIAWALGLECAMLAFYPMWLDLKGLMGEFTAMSVSGHVAYGAVLGATCHRRLSSSDVFS